MTAHEHATALWMEVMDYTRPEQLDGDDVRCVALVATALRTARRDGLEEAAKYLLYDENNVLDWTPMMRQTAGVFARAIRAQAAKEEA
jgi:hypothetical protein